MDNCMRTLVNALRPLTFSCLLMMGTFGSGAVLAHSGDKTQSYQQLPVIDDVVMLQGEGGNIGVLQSDKGLLVIDDGYNHRREVLMEALHHISPDNPQFLLNTHWHADHTGNNEALGKAGSTIVAHDNARHRLETGGEVKAFNMKIEPAATDALPIITYSKTMTLYWGDYRLLIDHPAPAHTDGDSMVYFYMGDKVAAVHTGDLFFNGFYPFIDGSSGGSIQGMIDGVAMVLSNIDDDTKIIPGHGPLANKADLQRYHNFLVVAAKRIGELKASGKSLTEVVAAQPLADYEADWGQGFLPTDKWIGIVYGVL